MEGERPTGEEDVQTVTRAEASERLRFPNEKGSYNIWLSPRLKAGELVTTTELIYDYETVVKLLFYTENPFSL